MKRFSELRTQFIIHFQLTLKEDSFDSSLSSWSFGNFKPRDIAFDGDFEN